MLDDGRVTVRVKSTRGTGTRDQDEVIVSAIYESYDEAREESEELTTLLQQRMAEARQMGSEPDTIPEKADDISTPEPIQYDTSKVYIGNGSRLGGWIPVKREIVFEKIAPLVTRNRGEESELTMKVNFSKDVPISGWNDVDVDIVKEKIEPLVREHRTDR